MPDPSLIPAGGGQDLTLIALAATAAWTGLQFLRKLGDLYLKRLARKWKLDDRDREGADD